MRWYIFHSEISHNIYQVLQVSWALSLSFKALKDSEDKKKNSKNRNNSKKTRKKTEKNEPIYVIIHTNIHREGERENSVFMVTHSSIHSFSDPLTYIEIGNILGNDNFNNNK